MVEEDRFELMRLDQLREAAIKKGILGASKLNKREILRILRRVNELEESSRKKLLHSLTEYRIAGVHQIPKRYLALLALQAERFEDMKVADLRTLARRKGLEGVSRLRKKEIVNRLMDSYVESLRSEVLPGKSKLSLSKQWRAVVKLPWKKWLGRAVQVASAVGIFLTVTGVVVVPILASRVSASLDRTVLTISQEVTMAAVSLQQMNLIIEDGVQTLEAAEDSVRSLGRSMDDTQSFINSTAELLVDHTPDIVEDTREALLSAEEGARAVDQVLRNLATLRFLTGVSYDPEKPLDQGISGVTDSLEPLPDALREVGVELDQAGASLDEVSTSLENMADELQDFTDEVSGKNLVLANLAGDLDSLSKELDDARGMIDRGLLMGAIIIELVLIGHALGQVAIFYVGHDMTRGEREDR